MANDGFNRLASLREHPRIVLSVLGLRLRRLALGGVGPDLVFTHVSLISAPADSGLVLGSTALEPVVALAASRR